MPIAQNHLLIIIRYTKVILTNVITTLYLQIKNDLDCIIIIRIAIVQTI